MTVMMPACDKSMTHGDIWAHRRKRHHAALCPRLTTNGLAAMRLRGLRAGLNAKPSFLYLFRI